MSLCGVLKSKDAVSEFVLPLLVVMLRDKSSDVRLNLLSTFDQLPNLREMLPLELLNDQILECIKGKPKKAGETGAAATAPAAAGTAAGTAVAATAAGA